jgi:hypothetical protein
MEIKGIDWAEFSNEPWKLLSLGWGSSRNETAGRVLVKYLINKWIAIASGGDGEV